MELSLLLLNQILVMALMVVVGAAVSRLGLITLEESRVLSRVTLYVITPCALIDAFQTELEPEKLEGMLAALIASALTMAAFVALAKVLSLGRGALSPGERASMIYSNAGNLIIPIVLNTLGEEFVIYSSVYMGLQTLLMWSHGRSLVQGGGRLDLRALFLNPCIISTFLGAALFFARIRLPSILDGTVSGLAACLGPLSMLSIGVLLANADLKGAFSSLRVYRVILLRLAVCPLVTILILKAVVALWPGRDVAGALTVTLLGAIGPTAVTITQLAQLADNPESGLMSSINAVTTILCAATMPVAIFLYQLLV